MTEKGITTLTPNWLRPLVLVAVILAAWEMAARSGLWSPLLFPPLERIGRELLAFATGAEGAMQAWVSLYRAFAGFGAAALVGALLGLVMGRSPFFAGLLEPLFSGTYAVPKLALFPIFIFVFGLGSLSKVALIFLECLYPMVIITSQGARNVPLPLLWSAANMGASRWRTLRRVVLPATMPYVFAALRVALPVALIVVVITEMISSVDGLGYLISYSLASLRTDRILALVVVISLLGLALDRALVALRDRLVYWEKLDTYYA
ncbi:MAG TPA: ABC transporter permease [Burkholderiales bacterium]